MVYGDLVFHYTSGQSITVYKSEGPTLIPSLIGCYEITLKGKSADEVIVVEKEVSSCLVISCMLTIKAVFKRLCDCNYSGTVITGKGYPDHSTQDLVYILSQNYSNICCLVDSDPDGINIFLQYMFGYHAQSKTTYRSNCCLKLKYLGVKIADYSEGWQDLKYRDLVLARNLLVRLASEYYNFKELETVAHQTISQNSLFSTQDTSTQDTNVIETLDNSESVSLTLDQLKIELQRQIFFGKKCEMNLIGNPGSVNEISNYITRAAYHVTSWGKTS